MSKKTDMSGGYLTKDGKFVLRPSNNEKNDDWMQADKKAKAEELRIHDELAKKHAEDSKSNGGA